MAALLLLRVRVLRQVPKPVVGTLLVLLVVGVLALSAHAMLADLEHAEEQARLRKELSPEHPLGSALPDGWEVCIDPASSCPYYHHLASGMTTWERPQSSDPPPTPSEPPRLSEAELVDGFADERSSEFTVSNPLAE